MHEPAMAVQAWGDSDSDRGVGGGVGGRGWGRKGVRGGGGWRRGEATLISLMPVMVYFYSDGISTEPCQ